MNQQTLRRPRAAGSDVIAGMIFWLTVLVLAGVSLGCVALGLARLDDPQIAEKNLHADPAIPKIANTNIDPAGAIALPASAEPAINASASREPNAAEPRVQTELHPKAEKLVMPLAVAAAPVLQQETVEPPQTPKAAWSTTSQTTVHTPQRDPTPGDTPMMRTWKTLALTSLLLASAPTYAPAADGDTDPKALKKSFDDLRKTVESMSAKLDKAAAAMSSKDVLAEINRLDKSLSALNDKLKKELRLDISAIQERQLQQTMDLQKLKGLTKQLEALEADVATINEELKKLRKQPGTPVPTAPSIDKAVLDEFHDRISRLEKLAQSAQAPGISGERKSFAAPVAGKVRLINQYVERMTFVVNGYDYFVEPGQMLELKNFPAGAVTYEVVSPIWGIRAQKTTALQPNETLSVTAR